MTHHLQQCTSLVEDDRTVPMMGVLHFEVDHHIKKVLLRADNHFQMAGAIHSAIGVSPSKIGKINNLLINNLYFKKEQMMTESLRSTEPEGPLKPTTVGLLPLAQRLMPVGI